MRDEDMLVSARQRLVLFYYESSFGLTSRLSILP